MGAEGLSYRLAKLTGCTFLAPLMRGSLACEKTKMERGRGQCWIKPCLKPFSHTSQLHDPVSSLLFPRSLLIEGGFQLKVLSTASTIIEPEASVHP